MICMGVVQMVFCCLQFKFEFRFDLPGVSQFLETERRLLICWLLRNCRSEEGLLYIFFVRGYLIVCNCLHLRDAKMYNFFGFETILYLNVGQSVIQLPINKIG